MEERKNRLLLVDTSPLIHCGRCLHVHVCVCPHMLMPLSFMLSSVRQDFDVPTSHLIGAHGYCTQVRRQWGPQRGSQVAFPILS